LGGEFVFLKDGLHGLAVRPAPGWLRQQYGILPRASFQKNKLSSQRKIELELAEQEKKRSFSEKKHPHRSQFFC